MSQLLDEAALLRSVSAEVRAVPITLELTTLRVLTIDHSIGDLTSIPAATWRRPDFWALHLHPDDRVALRLARTKARASGSALDLRVRVATDATEYLAVRLVCAREADDNLHGMLVPAFERASSHNAGYYRDRLAIAVDAAVVFLSEIDVARRVERADPRLSALLGFEPGELLTLDEWLARVVPEDRELVTEHLAGSLAKGAAHSVTQLPAIEYRVRCLDGRVVSLRRLTRVLRGRSGLPQRVLVAIQEVGDSAAVAAAGTAGRLATDAMLEAIPGFAAVLDAHGTVLATNAAWRRAADARFAAMGTNYLRALKKLMASGMNEAEPLVTALEKVLAGKTLHVVTDHRWPAHGATQRWSFVAQQLTRRGGALVIHRPTIARHQAAELAVLGAATDRVVQLAIAGELLSAITHDLRQPLAALRMNLAVAFELAQRNMPDHTEVIESITDALAQEERVSRKLAIVQDLVAQRATAKEPVDLTALTDEVARIAQTEAIARRVPFQTRLSSDLPLVLGDRRLIRAAMLGLVLDALGALNEASPARVSLMTRRVNSEHVEVAVCRFANDAPPSADWVLTIARAVADVDSAPITVDSDGKTRSCVRLRWRVGTAAQRAATPA